MTATEQTIELVRACARAADDKGGADVLALDVSEPLPLVDAFLIASGRSERNVVAISEGIEEAMSDQGYNVVRREGRAEGRWVLLDFGDVVAHVFHEEDRMYYGLERLWKDCPVIALGLPEAEHAVAAGE
jgi:ribosome-associated protein